MLKAAGIRRALVAGAGDIVVGDPPPDADGWTIAIAPLEPGQPGPARTVAPGQRGRLDLRRRRAVRRDRRPSLLAHHQSGDRPGGRGPRQRHGRRRRRRDRRRSGDDRLLLGPERGLKLVEETPGAAAIFVRSTPDGIKTFESSRFKQVPTA